MATSEQFVIRLAVNSSGVKNGIQSTVGQMERLYHGVKRTVEGFIALEGVRWGVDKIRGAMELGTQLNAMADRSRIAVEELQGLQFGVKKAGGEVEDITRGMKDMARAQIEAIKGNADLRASFRRYGITVDDLRNKKPFEIFKRIAEEMGKAPATAQVTDDAAAIFGKPSEVLLSSFRNGLIESSEEAKKLGLVLSREVTDELQRAQEEIDILTEKWKKFTARATATGLKSIREFIRDSADIIGANAIAKAVEKASGGGAAGKLIGKIVGRGILDQMKAEEDKQEADEKAKRDKRNQEAVGDSVKKETATTQAKLAASSDALARIGGFRGGVGDVSRIPFQQLEVQRRIETHLARIAQRAQANTEQNLVNSLETLVRDFRGAIIQDFD